MMPEETVQASLDLKAKTLLPVHWGKFSLALHPWNEPIERVIKKAEELQLFTPVYYKPKEPTVGRGRIEEENEFFFRTLGLSRILKIKINGKLYKIVD